MSQGFLNLPVLQGTEGILTINGDNTTDQVIAGAGGISVNTAAGTTTVSGAAFANKDLSNLSPTAINQNLLMNADGTLDIGSGDAGATYKRPRDLYLANSINLATPPGFTPVPGAISLGDTNQQPSFYADATGFVAANQLLLQAAPGSPGFLSIGSDDSVVGQANTNLLSLASATGGTITGASSFIEIFETNPASGNGFFYLGKSSGGYTDGGPMGGLTGSAAYVWNSANSSSLILGMNGGDMKFYATSGASDGVTSAGLKLQVASSGVLTLGNSADSAQHALNTASATSASAGSHGAVPAQVAGYITITVNGTTQKIPYFNS